jgi:NAD(P)-dependent dehydrogenase (short-subunit alcohol dehydrogenase family)
MGGFEAEVAPGFGKTFLGRLEQQLPHSSWGGAEGVHAAGLMGSDFEKQVVAGTPLGRFGQPEDIAGVAVFLASDAAGWVTGERISASGGFR